MSDKYNLTYIGGITEYKKRAIYTLNLKEANFLVEGIFKKKAYLYQDVEEVVFGEVAVIKQQLKPVDAIFLNSFSLFDRRIDHKLNYALVIRLKETTIVFAEEIEPNIKNAYLKLQAKINNAH